MKLFEYIFWATLGVTVLIVIANMTGLPTMGIGFRTTEEYQEFIASVRFFHTLTVYVLGIAFLNLLFGGVLFITRGIRNISSRRKDILVGILLIVLPIAVLFCYILFTGLQTV